MSKKSGQSLSVSEVVAQGSSQQERKQKYMTWPYHPQSSADKIVLPVDHGEVQLVPVGSQGDEQQDAVLEEEAANLAHPQPLERPTTIQMRWLIGDGE